MVDPEHQLAADAPSGRWVALLLAADLDVLAGRGDDAAKALLVNRSAIPDALADWATVITARAALQIDPSVEPATQPDAFTPFGSGALLEVRIRVAAGVLQRDLDSLEAAIEAAEHARLPIEGAEARLWALSLRDHASRHRNYSVVAGALHRCGVRGWDRRVERMTAVLEGETIEHVATSVPSDPAVDSLSAAERRVAEAVAGGLTNRETSAALIVSVKTVDFHLQQIYRKLGIRSRTELAIRMMQRNGK